MCHQKNHSSIVSLQLIKKGNYNISVKYRLQVKTQGQFSFTLRKIDKELVNLTGKTFRQVIDSYNWCTNH